MSFFIGLVFFASAAAEPPVPVTAPAEDRIVCKRVEDSETGSRMSASRICKRKSEWELQKVDDRSKGSGGARGRRSN